ncbi:hypothetical protein KOI35_13770 [Actinoplanes bogorensis]|uniref:Uncharacterized protein n=1 Tax=Paractinoplanes bogorensis TaxID=1610840 RepID=A0ABS5YNE7_9ACTN|nr:hypothetical protein [Actinoplanes bogorensis]MBU2664566.1 hypothetical protein [Actinoplanes bogorensis]
MESSNAVAELIEPDPQVEPVEPAPAPLIMLEPLEGDSGVCAVDGWCD